MDCSIELGNFLRAWRTGLNRISFLTMRHSTWEEESQTLQCAAHPCAQCGNVCLQSVQSNLDSWSHVPVNYTCFITSADHKSVVLEDWMAFISSLESE